MIDESILSKYYSLIGQTLNDLIPIEWKRVAMLAEVDDGWSSTTFYFLTEDGTAYHWGDIFEELGVDEDEFDEAFDELSELTVDFQEEFKNAGVDVWSSFTFDMKEDGSFKVDFNYDRLDMEAGTHTRHTIWAYETLGLIPEDDYTKKLLKEYLAGKGREDEIKF